MRPTLSVSGAVRGYSRRRFDTAKPVPRMSWDPVNTFNIWQRTCPEGTERRAIQFTQSSRSLFQQRWVAKRYLKGYHSDMIRTKQFERWYLPQRIPAIHVKQPSNPELVGLVDGKERAGGRTRMERFAGKKKELARAPTGTMLYLNVERRLDVCVFRACLAPSVYAARNFVISGHVKLNGQTIRNANTLLNPGDVFTVDPSIIPFLQRPKPKVTVTESEETAEASEASEDESAPTSSTNNPKNTHITAYPTENIGDRKTQIAAENGTYFKLPKWAQPHIFVPAYILPSYLTCSAVYVRHPTARAGYSEIPSPYDAAGELMALGWEWYRRKAPRMRSKVTRWWNPQRTKERTQIPRARDQWSLKEEKKSVIRQVVRSGAGKKKQKSLTGKSAQELEAL